MHALSGINASADHVLDYPYCVYPLRTGYFLGYSMELNYKSSLLINVLAHWSSLDLAAQSSTADQHGIFTILSFLLALCHICNPHHKVQLRFTAFSRAVSTLGIMPFLPPASPICDPNETQLVANDAATHDEAVDLAIERYITQILEIPSEGETKSFFIADLSQVTRQHTRWGRNLPAVRPYYGSHLYSHFPSLTKDITN
jgi:hypothetical protein